MSSYRDEVTQIKTVDDYLKVNEPKKDWVQSYDESLEFYRTVPPDRNHVVSCLGSFAVGGRVNIGTPQVVKEFESRFRPEFGLYGSVDLDTTLEECRSSYDQSDLDCYRITFKKKSVRLFDFDKIIDSLDEVIQEFSLPSVVSEIPYQADWKYQKFPKVSQVIGSWLRTFANVFDADGILFQSTKRREGKNLFLFFEDELEDAEQKLRVQHL